MVLLSEFITNKNLDYYVPLRKTFYHHYITMNERQKIQENSAGLAASMKRKIVKCFKL